MIINTAPRMKCGRARQYNTGVVIYGPVGGDQPKVVGERCVIALWEGGVGRVGMALVGGVMALGGGANGRG